MLRDIPMKTITLDITPFIVGEAERLIQKEGNRTCNCPVALALKNYCPNAEVFPLRFVFNTKFYPLPPALVRVVNAFDKELPIPYGSYELEVDDND